MYDVRQSLAELRGKELDMADENIVCEFSFAISILIVDFVVMRPED